MVASYPDNIRSFVPREDAVDLNHAADINDLQQEVTALQVALGRTPAQSDVYDAPDVATRLGLLEADVRPRVKALEDRMRRAAVTVRRESALQVNSSANWQTFALMPQVVTELNDFTTPVYDPVTGRFTPNAPAPGIWTFSATVTWESVSNPVGVRGLALVTSGGTQLTVQKTGAHGGEDQTLQLNWSGRLAVADGFHLLLRVKQTQGTALFLRADSSTTPCRADFTHVPG